MEALWMDVFVSNYGAVLRRRLPLLVAQWATTEADRTLQAESVYAQLKDRDPKELGRHAETYLLLAASGLLEQFDRHRNTGGAKVPALCRIPGDNFGSFAAQSLALTDVQTAADPASAAALLLSQHYFWPVSAIAEVLGLEPLQVHNLIVQGICRLGFNSHGS
jgi:hypothetical protein